MARKRKVEANKMGRRSSNTAKSVAKGAAGVALISSLVAGTAAMIDRDLRARIVKSASTLFTMIQDMSRKNVPAQFQRYQMAAQQISRPKHKKEKSHSKVRRGLHRMKGE